MRFLIYGAGALGQAIGCMLAADGHQVDLVLRPRFLEALHSSGLEVTGLFGEYRVPPAQIGLLTSLKKRNGSEYDAVLLTTKTYDTDSAITDIVGLSQCYCPVVSLQNGCGNLEKLEERLGRERSLAARVITGFEIERPGRVRITVSADAVHVGGCVRGVIPGAAKRLAEALTHAGLPSIAVADVYQSLFAKLLYNCALNPLGAVLGVHYGALAESDETRMIMDRVIEETFTVIATMGGNTPWPDTAGYRKVFYSQLVPATYHHRPSMLQDLENNKPTEVEAMVGYVAAQGRKYGVATPCCDLLAALVRFKQQRALQRS
ncbi:ketopantoate reductase family protein [uncultured Desulfobulbus sp.]|uniref:ketopantoate reductase family protein n=1 Tax=uncultured Desulfobulbus sp. TaxID=239745 RepID=UPI0029C8740F|nr:ketopantoate reductase family protein [uncultured Desulfobulbus sp.]